MRALFNTASMQTWKKLSEGANIKRDCRPKNAQSLPPSMCGGRLSSSCFGMLWRRRGLAFPLALALAFLLVVLVAALWLFWDFVADVRFHVWNWHDGPMPSQRPTSSHWTNQGSLVREPLCFSWPWHLARFRNHVGKGHLSLWARILMLWASRPPPTLLQLAVHTCTSWNDQKQRRANDHGSCLTCYSHLHSFQTAQDIGSDEKQYIGSAERAQMKTLTYPKTTSKHVLTGTPCKRGANQAVLVIHVCEVEGKISADGYPCRLQLCNAIQEWLQECYISKERIELKHRHRQHAAIQSIQEALEVPDAFRKAPRGSAMREFPRSQQVTNFPGWYLQRLSLITEFHLHTASCSRPTGL